MVPISFSNMIVHPYLWRFLGFGSSIAGFSCFALGSSFQKLFGQWNLLKIILYFTVSFMFSVFVLFVKPILEQFPKVFWWKTRVVLLVLLLTSLYSYCEDEIKEGGTKEKEYERILSLITFGAFALTSTSVSAQIKPGFEVGVSNFFLGCLIVGVLKMNFVIAVCLAISCYVGFVIRSFLDSQLEQQGEGGDTQHLTIEIPTLSHNETQGLVSDMRIGDQETDGKDVDTVLSSHWETTTVDSSLNIHPSRSTFTRRRKAPRLDAALPNSMQCSDHPYRSNPSGVCAFCLREKLEELVSLSSSSSYSPSSPFRSDGNRTSTAITSLITHSSSTATASTSTATAL